MNFRLSSRLLSVLSLGIVCSNSVSAQVISLNFVRSSDGVTALAAGETAGEVPALNWNNSTMANANAEATGIVLNDIAGAATTATATWQSGSASWSVPLTGTGAASDIAMMTGYLDQGGDGAGQVHTITITGIPYINYDVYLYHSSAGGANRTARYNANGTDIFTRNLAPAGVFDGFINSGYGTLAEAADLANPAGNFVRWQGLTDAALTLQGEGLGTADGGAGGDTRRAPIQGIQIVEVIDGSPVVANLAATNIDIESATANGDLISNGDGADPADVTIYWGTTDGGVDPLAWENNASAGSLVAPGTFSATLSGLTGNTVYYYRSFASNSANDAWASFSESFTTLPAPEFPEVENRPATLVGTDSATLNGELLNNGNGADTSTITIYWGLTDGGTDTGAWDNNVSAISLTSPGTFSANITGLAQNTLYYYRAYANNSSGPDWAPDSATFATTLPSANVISLNFVRVSNGATAMEVTDIAGVVPVSYWNNATQANANADTDFPLVDDTGVAFGTTATWQSGSASWSVATAGAGSEGDKKMMTGYLDQGGDGAGQIHMLSFDNIPYAYYDVYLYHSSSGGPNRTVRYTANGTDLFTRNLDPANTFDGFVNAQYDTLAEAALAGGNPAGNYVVWEGLSGTLTIEGEGLGDNQGGSGGTTVRAPIQGIQIVASSLSAPFEITDIQYDSANGTVTLTWNSEIGQTYYVETSSSMTPGEWVEIDDSQATETVSTYIHNLPNLADARLFYRIRQ
ncbi:hypothetical protein N9A94_08410 [Akkermansiaceae bacterium]|nr:hypothetical protein [Akkermansiaceae bacterium]